MEDGFLGLKVSKCYVDEVGWHGNLFYTIFCTGLQ
jgi:hypothetical protein